MKNLFVDFHPQSSVGTNYAKFNDLNPDVTVHFASELLGTLAATIEFLKNTPVDGIISSPKGLLNYAHALAGSHSFAWIGSTTERLSVNTAKAIRAGLGNNLWSWYASSETGIIALADGDMIETIPNVVGKVVPGVTVDFDDGEIIVKSGMTIDRYSDDAVNTAKRFKNGWYYTRDLGHMQDDLLILTGRKSG